MLVNSLAITRLHASLADVVGVAVGVADHVISLPVQLGVHKDASVLMTLELCSLPHHHNNPRYVMQSGGGE